jgi:hypothetical protein
MRGQAVLFLANSLYLHINQIVTEDMTNEYQLRLLPQTAASEQAVKAYVAREKGLDERTITHVRVLKRSIDARQRTIYVNLTVRVNINEMHKSTIHTHHYPDVSDKLPWWWWAQFRADSLPRCASSSKDCAPMCSNVA